MLPRPNHHEEEPVPSRTNRYKFAPNTINRPSQSFTTNSREFHGILPIPRANSTPRAEYSA